MPRKRIPANSNTAFFTQHMIHNFAGQPWKLWARHPLDSQFSFYGSYSDRTSTFTELQRLLMLGFECKPEYLKASIYTPSQKEVGR